MLTGPAPAGAGLGCFLDPLGSRCIAALQCNFQTQGEVESDLGILGMAASGENQIRESCLL